MEDLTDCKEAALTINPITIFFSITATQTRLFVFDNQATSCLFCLHTGGNDSSFSPREQHPPLVGAQIVGIDLKFHPHPV